MFLNNLHCQKTSTTLNLGLPTRLNLTFGLESKNLQETDFFTICYNLTFNVGSTEIHAIFFLKVGLEFEMSNMFFPIFSMLQNFLAHKNRQLSWQIAQTVVSHFYFLTDQNSFNPLKTKYRLCKECLIFSYNRPHTLQSPNTKLIILITIKKMNFFQIF